jgi:hypothetical protein
MNTRDISIQHTRSKIKYRDLFVKILLFCITNMSNLTVSCNTINVPVLNGNVSGVQCLLLIVCQGTHILYYQYQRHFHLTQGH